MEIQSLNQLEDIQHLLDSISQRQEQLEKELNLSIIQSKEIEYRLEELESP